MLNSLDPDQDQRFVGPNLGPNCLQSLLVYHVAFMLPGVIILLKELMYNVFQHLGKVVMVE